MLTQAVDCGPQVWDWAGVEGSWHGELIRWFKVTHRYAGHWSSDITKLSLEAVKSREAVESVYPLPERATLWSGFGDVLPIHGLSPIYFHGSCVLDYTRSLIPGDPLDYGTPGLGNAFIHGVVYLDSRTFHPPQVKYTIAITGGDATTRLRRLVYHGVEPWGPRSKAGVFGVSISRL